MAFKYHVCHGVGRKIVTVPTKYVETVKDVMRRSFDIPVGVEIILQIEDVDDFPGEWVDVTIDVEGVDLIYLLPDKAKLKVVQGINYTNL